MFLWNFITICDALFLHGGEVCYKYPQIIIHDSLSLKTLDRFLHILMLIIARGYPQKLRQTVRLYRLQYVGGLGCLTFDVIGCLLSRNASSSSETFTLQLGELNLGLRKSEGQGSQRASCLTREQLLLVLSRYWWLQFHGACECREGNEMVNYSC